MTPSDIKHRTLWVALSLSPHIGAATLTHLLRHFDNDLPAICAASSAELRRAPSIGAAIAREIKRIDPDAVARDIKRWQAMGVRILTPSDRDFPQPLLATAGYPPTLFVRGACWESAFWDSAIAIVGTRHPSSAAKQLTLQLALKLARCGRVIVSGLALGIDAAAHSGALAAQGATVAVLGSGALNVYPPQNKPIAERIMVNGALISELNPAANANAQRLVSRNRIISGLSRALVVVESDADAGAMHTARFAREQDRPVFTFPFPAKGNQELIKTGAALLPMDVEKALPYLLRLTAGGGLATEAQRTQRKDCKV